MEFLERIIREHSGLDLLSHLEDEGIAPSDGACWRGHEFTGQQSGFIFGPLGGIDTVREGGVDDHGDLVDLVLLHEGGHGVVELTQTWSGAALGGDVGAIDDHMGSDHGGLVLFRWGMPGAVPAEAAALASVHRGIEPGSGRWLVARMQGDSLPL